MDNSLHEKLIAIEASLPEIEKQLSEIDISNDQKAYAEMAKKHSDVSAIVDDELENAFLQDFMDTIQDKPDDERIDASVTQELQKWIASKYNANTVKK